MKSVYTILLGMFLIMSCNKQKIQTEEDLVTDSNQTLVKGFVDHGVGSPSSISCGTVATVDGNGRNVVLIWLRDHRGGYALLMINAETGQSEEFPMPFSFGGDYSPFSSILSSRNKFYTLFKGYFVEFDPVKRAFTFSHLTNGEAMGMTEDDKGLIWAVTYPKSGVISFNPNTREFRDYGFVYNQSWNQYQRYVSADDAGWIYFGIGNTASQIIALDPATGQATPMLSEAERKVGTAHVYRDVDGKVYGQSLFGSTANDWYEFYKGIGRKIGSHPVSNRKPIITAGQWLFYRNFPDGKKIKTLDLLERKLVVEDPTGGLKEVSFDYTSEGAWIMGVATSPDGTIAGGTTFPMRFINYNPKTNKLLNKEAFGQFNALARQGDRLYLGVYTHGSLLEWDPSKPWINTIRGSNTNPLFLADGFPDINRPHRVLAYSDGKTIIMSGTPEYGYTGGGLLFWDRSSNSRILLQDKNVILNQSTMSMVALPKGKLLGGTTTNPGTGGQKLATEAELYIMDMASKSIEWHAVLFPGVQEYSDMCMAPNGLVFGIADKKNFFVFDPVKRAVINQQSISATFGSTTAGQSPRIFVSSPQGIYLLVNKGIVKVQPGSFKMTMIAQSPVPVSTGGDYLDGRIYFVSGSHLYSYGL